MWFDASRWYYNKAVEVINAGMPRKGSVTVVGGEKVVTHRENWQLIFKAVRPWAPARFASVPFQIKKLAVRDADRAAAENRKRVKAGRIDNFHLRFRSRKLGDNHAWIVGSAIKNTGVYVSILGRLRTSGESLPPAPKDSTLTLVHGRYLLNAPEEVPTTARETQASIVAIDPGVRVFASFFGVGAGNEYTGHIGRGCARRIARLALQADRLVSLLCSPGSTYKYRLKRALNRIKWKIRNLRSELHNQTVNWLCNTFEVIILPTFQSSEMVVRATRKIRSKTVRSMLTLGFYQFAQKLHAKASARGNTVVRCSEAYTSKTNSWTGEIRNIGGAKWIAADGQRIDRDLNGARGIFLRALGDTPEASNRLWRTGTDGSITCCQTVTE